MTITFDSTAAEELGIPLDLAAAIVLYDHGVEINPLIYQELKRSGVLIGGHISKIILDRLKGSIQVDHADSGKFDEILAEYPEFDHLRPLHDTSDKIKGRYLRKVLARPELHNEVLEAIRREKRYRAIRLARGEFIEAWKNLSKYIETEGWNKYMKDLPEEKVKTGTGYGEQEL